MNYPATRIRIDVKSVRLEILRAIRSLERRGNSVEGIAIAREIECSHNTFKNHIPALMRDGLVDRIAGSGKRPGVYFLTTAGQNLLREKDV